MQSDLNKIYIVREEGNKIVLDSSESNSLRSLFLGTAQSIGVAQIDPNAKSGNPAHDAHSGKFGSTGPKPKTNALPANTTDPGHYIKLRDLVIDAAREIGITDPNSLLSFIKGRTARPPSESELNQILAEVQKARISELVDWVDAQMSGRGRKRSSSRATISAPRIWVRRAFEQATDQDVTDIVNRLEAKGWDRQKAVTTTLNKLPDKSRRQTLKDSLG